LKEKKIWSLRAMGKVHVHKPAELIIACQGVKKYTVCRCGGEENS